MRKLVLLFILFSSPLLAVNPPNDKSYGTIYYKLKDYSSEILDEKGIHYFNQNQLDSALICFTIVSRRYTESMSDIEKKRCAKAYNLCGIIHSYYSNYTLSYTNYLKATEIGEELNDYIFINKVYNNIAGILYYYGDYAKALEYLGLAYRRNLERNDLQGLMSSIINIIRLNFSNHSIEDADAVLTDFLKLEPQPNDFYHYTLQVSTGTMNVLNGNFEEAIHNFKTSIEYTDSLWMSQQFVYNAYSYIAETFAMMERYDSSIVYMKRCEEIAVEYAYPVMITEAYRTLGNYFEKAGNKASSLDYKLKYQEISDSIFNTEEYGRIKDMQSFYELDKIEKQVHRLTVEKKQKNKLLAIAGSTLTIIVLLLFGVFHQNRRLVTKNQSLFRKNMEIIKSEEAEKGIRKEYEAKLHEYESRLHEIPMVDKQKSEDGGRVPHKTSGLSDEYRTQLVRLIHDVMDNTKEVFTPDFSLEKLASLVNSNTNYVSKVINEQFEKNFNTFLNEYRIREACKRILDLENYGNLTFEAIAVQLGFNSRTSFNRSFKSITGLTPSEYQKMARESLVE